MDRLEKCQSAKMGIYFHDIYNTAGAAKLIINGLKATKKYKRVSFDIVHLQKEFTNKEDAELVVMRAKELRDYIRSMGYKSKIKKRVVHPDDLVGASRRAALLRVKVSR